MAATVRTVTIHMDGTCSACGRKRPVSESGLCLECITKRITGGPMPRRRDAEDQPPLVPLSEEEMQKAGKKLARMTGELEAMEVDHAEIRKEQKTERDKLRSDINGLAQTIRDQGR